MRGKPEAQQGKDAQAGITPACAGKTFCQLRSVRRVRDHPRVCGENLIRAQFVPACPGSPPRVRGKRAVGFALLCGTGITPACAGKTLQLRHCTLQVRDHPRVCGENKEPSAGCGRRPGSPPRVRGKPGQICKRHDGRGITPACAGKTSLDRSGQRNSGDHPRVCGENNRFEQHDQGRKGSPPRVRGKPCSLRAVRPTVGITPACAGKTLRKWRISVVDPSPQPQSSLTFRRADASIGSQRAPCAAPV